MTLKEWNKLPESCKRRIVHAIRVCPIGGGIIDGIRVKTCDMVTLGLHERQAGIVGEDVEYVFRDATRDTPRAVRIKGQIQ